MLSIRVNVPKDETNKREAFLSALAEALASVGTRIWSGEFVVTLEPVREHTLKVRRELRAIDKRLMALGAKARAR